MRKVTKSAFVQKVIGWTASLYLKSIFYTSRWTFQGREQFLSPSPFIVVFWHSHMAMAPFAWRTQRRFFMLISGHSDGRMIAHTVKNLGIESIAGSTARGGTIALRQLLRALEQGHCVGVTPDGPRGPKETVHPGLYTLAKCSQCPVYPLAFYHSHMKKLRTWDRFLLPFPFGRGAIVVGAPVLPPTSSEPHMKEMFLREVSRALSATVKDAQSLVAL